MSFSITNTRGRLHDIFTACALLASKDETRANLCGVALHFHNEGVLAWVATNGHALVELQSTYALTGEKPSDPILIPIATVKAWIKALAGKTFRDRETMIEFNDDGQMALRLDNAILHAPRVKTCPIPYLQIIPARRMSASLKVWPCIAPALMSTVCEALQVVTGPMRGMILEPGDDEFAPMRIDAENLKGDFRAVAVIMPMRR